MSLFDPARMLRAQIRSAARSAPNTSLFPGCVFYGSGWPEWAVDENPPKKLPEGDRWIFTSQKWIAVHPHMYEAWFSGHAKPIHTTYLNAAIQLGNANAGGKALLAIQRQYLKDGMFVPWPLPLDEALDSLALRVSIAATNPLPKSLPAEAWSGVLPVRSLYDAFRESPPRTFDLNRVLHAHKNDAPYAPFYRFVESLLENHAAVLARS